jgi:hypothetical protein
MAAPIGCLSQSLQGRLAWRLLPLMAGALFAHGRRTVASWLRGADCSPSWVERRVTQTGQPGG